MDHLTFDVTLVRKDGSLGFTIHKKEDGFLYVKDVIKEPAISEPFLTPGDRILLVNGVDASSLSHSGAISFLRSLPDTVTLKLQIPEDIVQDFDPASSQGRSGSCVKKRKPLRPEARLMIKEKASSPNPAGCDSLSRLKNRNRDRDKSRTTSRQNSDDAGIDQQQHQPHRPDREKDRTTSRNQVVVTPTHSSPISLSGDMMYSPVVCTNPFVTPPDDHQHNMRTTLSHPILTSTPIASSGVSSASCGDSLASGATRVRIRETKSADALNPFLSDVQLLINESEPVSVFPVKKKSDSSCSSNESSGLSVNNSSPHDNKNKKISKNDGNNNSNKCNNYDSEHKCLTSKDFTKWRGHNLDADCGFEQDSGFGDCTPKTSLEKPLRISLLKQQGFSCTPQTPESQPLRHHQPVNVVVVESKDQKTIPLSMLQSEQQNKSSSDHPSVNITSSRNNNAAHVTSPSPQIVHKTNTYDPVDNEPVGSDSHSSEPYVMEVTLVKGWASRLGIQLEEDHTGIQPHACVVKQIVPNTVASSDGRIRIGSKLLTVNQFDLKDKPVNYVIDLLRKMKGKIHMTFLVP